jgi:uncharacterized protein
MKCGFASDLHGSQALYRELFERTRSESLELVILGGDLLPRKGHHAASLAIQKEFAAGEFSGFAGRIRECTGRPLCVITGNDDWAGALPLIRAMESEGLVRVLDGRVFSPDGKTHLFGYSFVPPTPFLLKDFERRDLSADPPPDGLHRIYVTRDGRVQESDERAYFEGLPSIEDDLNAPPFLGLPRPSVAVMHGPPYGTSLDRLYDGRSAGSRAVRAFLLREQPLLSLHGHIHESPAVSGAYAEWIGETLSVNPGQSGDRVSGVLFDLSNPAATMTHTVRGPVKPNGTPPAAA